MIASGEFDFGKIVADVTDMINTVPSLQTDCLNGFVRNPNEAGCDADL